MMQHTQSPPQRFEKSWVLGDSSKRSLVKTVTWRITGSGATFLIAYLLIGSFALAGIIGVTQLVSNTVLYYLHERLWNKVKWGKV